MSTIQRLTPAPSRTTPRRRLRRLDARPSLTQALDRRRVTVGCLVQLQLRVIEAFLELLVLAPDANETSQSQQAQFPVTDVFSYVEVADGRVWMRPEGVACFAGDLPEEEQKVVWATHAAPAADLFNQKVGGTAWRSKPSWYIVATKDRTVQPELERFVAKRMGAITVETASSHVPMLSNPALVLDVIRNAANAVQKA
ncbi:MAG TPA: alpha/beta fold hydrolase [Gemmatimonadales bacterium]|nr:alpha/beta fold hydrolase [Gemmatimonadales bacterium]